MIIFIGFSLSDDLGIGSYTLTKARFPETLLKDAYADERKKISEANDTIAPATIAKELAEPDTTVHNVLVFGDSMTHHLAMSIAKYGTKNGYHVTGVTWESSSIPGWSHSGKIRKYIDSIRPDFIFISLGANEMELKYFDRRIPEVKKILEQVDTIPFVWVGPPLWKEDKGVYSMLEEALPKGVVFKADQNLDIPRGKDKVHPTMKGADVWVDSLMRWMPNSPHPILSEKPDSGTSTKGHKFIYLHPND